jgi:prophage regulatory protein
MSDTQTPRMFLRLPEVLTITGLSRSTIYKWVNEGDFPKPKQLGPRAIAWDSNEIATWSENRPSI